MSLNCVFLFFFYRGTQGCRRTLVNASYGDTYACTALLLPYSYIEIYVCIFIHMHIIYNICNSILHHRIIENVAWNLVWGYYCIQNNNKSRVSPHLPRVFHSLPLLSVVSLDTRIYILKEN